MYKPSCFIIMPFGKKTGKEGITFDFDMISEILIKPAIARADLSAVRADEEKVDGIIHKSMYERLILCDYAIADVTTANANVYYELGMRHTIKPYTTICLMSNKTKLEFDLNLNRTYTYEVDDHGRVLNQEIHINAIADKLQAAKMVKTTDSPVHQLVEGISFQNSLAHEKTDVFRDRVKYESSVKNQLATIRNHKVKEEKLEMLHRYVESIRPLENLETGILIDVMLTYRALSAWPDMVRWIESLPEYVFSTQMVQEQYGFALNRNGNRSKAIATLEHLIQVSAPNPETNGILGRVYKDLADDHSDDAILKRSYTKKAIRTYLDGFEADTRDAYPGVNAVTLMFMTGDDRYHRLIPVVEFAVKQKMKKKNPDYWDYATLLELAVIEENTVLALEYYELALPEKTEGWMGETTANNLKKIITVLEAQGKDAEWVKEIKF